MTDFHREYDRRIQALHRMNRRQAARRYRRLWNLWGAAASEVAHRPAYPDGGAYHRLARVTHLLTEYAREREFAIAMSAWTPPVDRRAAWERRVA